ncbi:MAG: hypothetical protein QOI39_3548, partial [Mycobacterium sp.]|nr:hypothetical protein [Mycobacterium sp.]
MVGGNDASNELSTVVAISWANHPEKEWRKCHLVSAEKPLKNPGCQQPSCEPGERSCAY